MPNVEPEVTPIVLAAGPGSRLWPLTASRPKPMVPVAGRPILEWCLQALVDAGLDRAVVVVGHRAASVQSHFQDGRELGIDLTYVQQDQQAGTAHAVATALEAEGLPGSALVVGGDNVIEADLVRALIDQGPDALALTKSREPSKYGVVSMAGETVRAITEKPHVEGEALIWTGACLLSRDTLDALGRLVGEGLTDLPSVLNEVIASDGEVHACITTGDWLDAVYPWDLVPMAELLLSTGAARVSDSARVDDAAVVAGAVRIDGGATLAPTSVVTGPTSLGANVRVDAGGAITRSLVLDGVRVGTGAVVEDSVVGEGARIGAGAVLGSDRARPETEEGIHDVARMGAVVGEGTTVGPGAVLAPGTILGAGVTVAAGARVSGRIPDGGWVT